MKGFPAAVAGAALLLSAPAPATTDESPFAVTASLRTRAEAWRWFEPDGGGDDDYVFGATVLRAGIGWTRGGLSGLVEGQSSALFGLPDDAVAPVPGGPLGLGAVYFAHNRAKDDASVFLKQGYVAARDLGVTGLTLRAGRFEFAEGLERVPADPTFAWLRKQRIAQRLIGSFAWSHIGRSFDGILAAFDRGSANVTGLLARPTQGGFDLAGMKTIDEIDLTYLALTITQPPLVPGLDTRIFHSWYADGRDLVKTDNRPADVRAADRRDVGVHTVGAHAIAVVPTGAGPVDLLAWSAGQTGRWGRLDHRAWAKAFEAGLQPTLPARPWLRLGLFRSSGDDDPADGDHGSFFQILPTARIYSLSTFYNLMNDEDAFVQILARPVAGVVVRADVHAIRATERRDLWYQGAGATLAGRNVGFGYAGRPTGGHRDVLRVVEAALQWTPHPRLSVEAYYAHVFGAGAVRSLFAGDDADFAYLEATVRF